MAKNEIVKVEARTIRTMEARVDNFDAFAVFRKLAGMESMIEGLQFKVALLERALASEPAGKQKAPSKFTKRQRQEISAMMNQHMNAVIARATETAQQALMEKLQSEGKLASPTRDDFAHAERDGEGRMIANNPVG